jgi:catechol 2,3-dioxygenase-like lactoylglutathione lyase family enzyme
MSDSSPGSGGIPHVFLRVSEMERSVRFYEALFGVPVHKRRKNSAVFHVLEPVLRLKLLESGILPAPAPAYRGLSVPTSGDVTETKARLIAQGITSFGRTDTRCCSARDEFLWVHDPDGHAWEVYTEADSSAPNDVPTGEAKDSVIRRGEPAGSLLPPDDSCCSLPDAC